MDVVYQTKRIYMKKLYIVLAVLAMTVLAFVGCGGGNDSSLPTGTSVQSDEALGNDKFAE